MKIAIVGSSPATMHLAPYDDSSWDIWTLAWRDAKRSDAMFEMHSRAKWENHGGPDYEAKLAKVEGAHVYMLEVQPGIPASLAYPFEEVKANLAPKGAECDFFTSSLAYMLAFAISCKPDEIGLFGADMCAEEEYGYQRPAMTYLVGLARGRGIKVTVPEPSPLLKANFQYGDYTGSDHAFPQAAGVTEDVLVKRLRHYQQDREATQVRMNNEIARMNTLDGTIAEVKALIDAVRHFNRGGVIA